MTRQLKHKNNDSGVTPEKNIRMDFEDDLPLNSEESALFGMISDYMKGRFDIEDVSNDPALPDMRNIVDNMISDYHKKKRPNKDNEKFIRDIFSEVTSDEKIMDEIDNIKHEISNSNVSEISAEWVKEWNEKRQRSGGRDLESEENRDFITSALQSEKSESETGITGERKNGLSRSLIPYFSLSAAAIISAFILIRTLLPSYNPEKLFNSYYEPFSAILPETRSFNSAKSDNYALEIEQYKLGDYQSAADGFSKAILKDKLAPEPRFYMGLTLLALENYDQAINLLSDITILSGENGKEAGWYLGLAYLITGDKEKATDRFKELAKTPGFYRERAIKILRHLK